MNAVTLSKIDKEFRNYITRYVPPSLVVTIYSLGRKYFLSQLKHDIPSQSINPPSDLTRTLWNINFRSPIMNAAGMFKEGDCYEMTVKQGAGAYLGGTGTWNPRRGNTKNNVHLPFVPYPQSGSSSNFMGLPNKGDSITSQKVSRIKRISDMPIGWSIMASPDLDGVEQHKGLIYGMRCYEDAGVDFIEWNISCPNVSRGRCESLEDQISYVEKNYLKTRESNIPVIIKISNDKTIEEIPYLLDLMFSKGFHGINIGGTSTQYNILRDKIHPNEIKLYDYFTKKFNGGISGKPLKEKSLELGAFAVNYLKAGSPSQEFHVIRTGGIENWNDIMDSERAGIKLNQWFTGYFEGFSKHGHDVYKKLYESRVPV